MILALLVLAPPFICTVIYPTIFLIALNTAGWFWSCHFLWHFAGIDGLEGRYGMKWILNRSYRVVGPFSDVIAFAIWVMALQF